MANGTIIDDIPSLWKINQQKRLTACSVDANVEKLDQNKRQDERLQIIPKHRNPKEHPAFRTD